MTRDELEQAIYERTRDFVGVIHLDCILELIADEREKEREACIKVIGAYRIPIGNSEAGELARDWTLDALKYIRDEIRARGNK
jgi:hypothetical protein